MLSRFQSQLLSVQADQELIAYAGHNSVVLVCSRTQQVVRTMCAGPRLVHAPSASAGKQRARTLILTDPAQIYWHLRLGRTILTRQTGFKSPCSLHRSVDGASHEQPVPASTCFLILAHTPLLTPAPRPLSSLASHLQQGNQPELCPPDCFPTPPCCRPRGRDPEVVGHEQWQCHPLVPQEGPGGISGADP